MEEVRHDVLGRSRRRRGTWRRCRGRRPGRVRRRWELRDQLVDLLVLGAAGVGLLAAGEDPQEQHLAARMAVVDVVEDRLDAQRHVAGRIPLLVPIIRTMSLGWIPSSSPLRRRQITCSVRSPLMPKLAALRGAKYLSQTAFPPPRQPSVMESPMKSRSTPPALATLRNSSWRLRSFSSGSWSAPPCPAGRRRKGPGSEGGPGICSGSRHSLQKVDRILLHYRMACLEIGESPSFLRVGLLFTLGPCRKRS